MKKGIIALLSAAVGGAAGAVSVTRTLEKKVAKEHSMSDKHLTLFLMMNQWVKVKQEGKNLSIYFEEYGYKRIAVYGMSYAGETLIDELKGTGIQVVYGIDKNAESVNADVDVYTMEDNLGDVDAVVVTAVAFFNEIEKKLTDVFECPILSLEEILYGI